MATTKWVAWINVSGFIKAILPNINDYFTIASSDCTKRNHRQKTLTAIFSLNSSAAHQFFP
jgi:hypothetical protein